MFTTIHLPMNKTLLSRAYNYVEHKVDKNACVQKCIKFNWSTTVSSSHIHKRMSAVITVSNEGKCSVSSISVTL